MKKWRYTLAARIVAGLLFMIFAMGTLLGAGACVALFQYNAFNDGGKELFDAAADYLMDRETAEIRNLLSGNWNGWTDGMEHKDDRPYCQIAPNNGLQPTRTNFRYRIYNEAGELLFTNGDPQQKIASRQKEWIICLRLQQFVRMEGTYPSVEEAYAAVRERREALNAWSHDADVSRIKEGEYHLSAQFLPGELYTVKAEYCIDGSFPVLDRYSVGLTLVNTLIACRNWAVPLTALCLALAVAAFIFLLVSAGHRTGTAEVARNWFDRIPLELVLLGMALLVGFGGRALTDRTLTVLGLFLPMLLALGLLFSMTFAVRCKTKTLVKGTLLYWVCRGAWAGVKWVWYIFRNLNLVWKTALIYAGISLVEFIAVAGWSRGPVPVVWVLEKLIITPVLFAFVIGLKKLQDGARRMAEGDMAPIDEKFLFPDEKKHAQSLNSIGQGARLAAEKQLRSERMKTELITNVSHDLKTPLTSIITYVDLLKKEGLTSEHAPEYVEVLDRQSQRLKKLTEDLVEASKASTGNIQTHPEDVDVNLLLSQAAGEYAERLTAAGLTLVTTLDPGEPHIRADGRLLWRVFDNLLSNVCKYALAGTRVYLTTEAKNEEVRVAFRNVSREPLNISAEELMERFVRGDASRNTEGSGLGLSIARSLTELNRGALELTVDGDLFKATLVFQ